MYLQITTRCNMACGHCCYSCTKLGSDMPRDVVVAAMKLAYDMGDSHITIGGGEPTLHKNFWDYFGLVLSTIDPEDGSLHVATNGTVEKSALALARLARAGIVNAELSRTDWHLQQKVQPSQKVIDAFTRKPRTYGYSDREPRDYRGVRSETGSYGTPFAVGRAEPWGVDGCCCDTLHVDPDGTLYACGCRKERLGTVFHPEIPASYLEREDRCSKANQAEDNDQAGVERAAA